MDTGEILKCKLIEVIRDFRPGSFLPGLILDYISRYKKNRKSGD